MQPEPRPFAVCRFILSQEVSDAPRAAATQTLPELRHPFSFAPVPGPPSGPAGPDLCLLLDRHAENCRTWRRQNRALTRTHYQEQTHEVHETPSLTHLPAFAKARRCSYLDSLSENGRTAENLEALQDANRGRGPWFESYTDLDAGAGLLLLRVLFEAEAYESINQNATGAGEDPDARGLSFFRRLC
jgi:hypothetical protein